MKTKSNLFIIVVLMLIFALSACSPVDNGLGVEPSFNDSGELPPVAVVKAREVLAGQLDIEVENVEILSQEQTEWLDSCLGLGGPAESCLQAIFPGWRVELSADGQTYYARTDELGDIIRFEQ